MDGNVTGTQTGRNVEREPDYEQLLWEAVEKTKAGKLTWTEDSEPDTFVADANGKLRLRLAINERNHAILRVLSPEGEILFSTPDRGSTPAFDLYDLAYRMGTKLDEKIRSAMDVIHRL